MQEYADGLERISGQRPDEKVLCRFGGQGWDSEFDNWDQTLGTIDAIVEFLTPTIRPLLSKAEKHFSLHGAALPR